MLTNLRDIGSKRITLPSPREHQIPELLSPARFKVSVHGRRWGKSIMGLIACVAGHGPYRRWPGAVSGASIWWVAPTYPIGSIIWRLLKAACRDGWQDKSEVDRRIDFLGGGSVTIKSSDNPDGLRGEGLDGVVLDEAAFISEEVWHESLRPALSDKRGWAWFISTPNGRNWLHKVFERAKAPEAGSLGWSAWQGPTTTQTVPQEELDAARHDLGTYAFRQEYLAEFVQPGGGFFKRHNFRYYLNGGGTYKLGEKAVELDKCRRGMTVDLAASTKTSADYTVVTSYAVTPDKDLVVLDVQRARMEGPDQVPMIRRAFERWRPGQIKIESVGYQLAMIQAARRDGLPIVELKRDKDKVSRACLLQARMEGGGVWLPEQASWLRACEDELCDFPQGDHDDMVDTLADAAIDVALNSGFKVW